MTEQYKHILVDKADGVLTLTLNRPEVGNAVNGDLHADMSRVFHDVRDDDARVIVLTGAGESFCETGDMDYFQTLDRNGWLQIIREARWIIKDLMTVEQPLIAKVNGTALGIGMSLALAGDLIYAADTATMGDPHVLFGVTAGDGAAALLPNMVSLVKAKEMLFLGRNWTAQELADHNIINGVVPAAELDDAVDAVAKQLAQQPPEALRWTKLALNSWAALPVARLLDMSTIAEGWSWELPEHKEALATYLAQQEQS